MKKISAYAKKGKKTKVLIPLNQSRNSETAIKRCLKILTALSTYNADIKNFMVLLYDL